MASHNVTTAREALMAELLQDADALVRRFEQIDETLATRIEKAAADAAGKSFLGFKLSFESMIESNAAKITDAGRHASACMGNQLNRSAATLTAQHIALEKNGYRLMGLQLLLSMLAGGIGGYVGAMLAGA